MKIFLAATLLFAVAFTGAYSQACHFRELDLCAAMGVIHYQSNGVPANDESVFEFCETMKEVQDCVGNYVVKCMSPLQREIMQLLSGGNDVGKEMCTTGSEVRTRYLEQAECLSEAAESDDFKEIMRDLQVLIEKMYIVPFESRFSLFCCGFERFRSKIANYTEARCGEGAVEMVSNIMKMITSDMPKTMCQQYDPVSEQCQQLLPKPKTQPRGGDDKSNMSKLFDTLFGSN